LQAKGEIRNIGRVRLAIAGGLRYPPFNRLMIA
jgi:hypothetical protein